MRLNIYKVYSFLLFLLVLPSAASANQLNSISLDFYSEKINVGYYSNMVIDFDLMINERLMVKYFKQMEETMYQTLLSDLKSHKDRLALNDWLFYELVHEAVDKIYEDKSDQQKTLNCWFLLSKAGYNTRLTYLKNNIFLYAYSLDEIFETPMIEDKGKIFINLTNIHDNPGTKGIVLNMLSFVPNPDGQPFSFDLSSLPKLTPSEKNKILTFTSLNNHYEVNVQFDHNLIRMMENYPIFEELKYIQTPLSNLAAKSLLPQLKRLLRNKSEKEALEVLVSFTRSAFSYKDDHDHFGKNKPMIGDELFFYPFSDCEDRSALFYFLVKELLNLPMIVIAYEDHLTIAVASSKIIGNPIDYMGNTYFICDPTGPYNSSEVGNAPIGYENKKFEILNVPKFSVRN